MQSCERKGLPICSPASLPPESQRSIFHSRLKLPAAFPVEYLHNVT